MLQDIERVNNYWVGMGKNRWGLIYHGTLKSGASRKWFNEFRRLIELFFHVDSDGITFCFTANLCIFDI